MENCLFCKIVKKEIPADIVYEDYNVMAFLDIHPTNPGHTLLVPKKHFDNCLGTEDKDLQALLTTAKKIAPAVLRATGSEAFNIGINCGSIAGQVIMHTHLHLMPRFPNDGLKHWPAKDMAKEELNKIAQKIKKLL